MAHNAHIANNEKWFCDYTPFISRTAICHGRSVEVLGIGDVPLTIHARDAGGDTAPIAHTLVLKDVLHCPDAMTNVVAADLLDGYAMVTNGTTYLYQRATDQIVLLGRPKLHKLWLVGQERDHSSWDEDTTVRVHVTWSAAERERWNALNARRSKIVAGTTMEVRKSVPYNGFEKVWLKDTFRSEFYFLRDHGLSIFDEQDREQGRQIARCWMMLNETLGHTIKKASSPGLAVLQSSYADLRAKARAVEEDLRMQAFAVEMLETPIRVQIG